MIPDKINISDFDYDLPLERIAQYPAAKREDSKLLLFDGNIIKSDIFRNIDKYIFNDSLLVFNNTRVIRARLLFKKASGAMIEIMCNEPLSPPKYEESLISKDTVEWKCIIGNLKKWKSGILSTTFIVDNKIFHLTAKKISIEDDAWRVRFSWDNKDITFGRVLELAGHIPLPPYIQREDKDEDSIRYQTVYSLVDGSVAAPTAGLHFTSGIINKLSEKKVGMLSLTLHVGAGTFQPVRTSQLADHHMHFERFFITQDIIKQLIEFRGRIIAVGTTSVRALESLYWLGLKINKRTGSNVNNYRILQWEPFQNEHPVSVYDSLTALYESMVRYNIPVLTASTQIMIVPGYKFKIVDSIITNFHQPRSSLILLIAAWTGADWKRIYNYAIENDFRFLSYGDSSFLYKPHNKRFI
jgi:S-adenosylmethionine:tRNA ribosyltransferase-isomerase